MQITDPIADLLTRIRNASTSKHETVDVPASKMKKAIVEILDEEGYIEVLCNVIGYPDYIWKTPINIKLLCAE